MAIAKTIQIHSSADLKHVERYIENPEKAMMNTEDSDLDRVLRYDMNEDKTRDPQRGTVLVSGYLCNPGNAAAEFQNARALYESLHRKKRLPEEKREICAVHLVMSFPEVEHLNPELVHRIGMEFVSSLRDRGLGDYQAIVSTHLNTAHLHNHILINSYSIDGKRKFADNKRTLQVLRELNDAISRKYGLPVLEQEPVRGEERARQNPHGKTPEVGADQGAGTGRSVGHPGNRRSESMPERQARLHGRSWKEQLRQDIDAVIELSSSCEDWKKQMRELGYEIRELNSGLPISAGFDSWHIRLSRLGPDYSPQALIARIARATGLSEDLIAPKPPGVPEIYFDRIPRYDAAGNRRTALEILLLRLIHYVRNLIQYMKALNRSEETRNLQKQLEQLEKAMELLSGFGITSKTDLRRRKKDAGHRIRTLQAQKSFYQQAQEKIRRALAEDDLPESAAAFYPATPLQRRELYQLLKEKKVSAHVRFEELTALMADRLLSCLTGPEEDWNAKIQIELEKERGGGKPDREQLGQMAEHAAAALTETKVLLAQADREYQDLVFLGQILRTSEDIYEELREEKAKRRKSSVSSPADSRENEETGPGEESALIEAWCSIPGAAYQNNRFWISDGYLSKDAYQKLTVLAEELNELATSKVSGADRKRQEAAVCKKLQKLSASSRNRESGEIDPAP